MTWEGSTLKVASKNGQILAKHQGTIKIGGLRLTKVLQKNKLAVNLISVGMLYNA
ncbi:hypothetical protein CROQUDRAFT_653215 [Cronartium quercuum f. sp. fusiforme G11]|uniref:Uncharacterized protein n=1 Tax=Cronartium quercuum f. sp. fusiforme G11 TaxID=708437 RepID=A0A9P6TEZ8_9BASI|nr:hypothetical protein CROQUDRAFT_653215 [Cronartium quercuum f. sp. fusiforme G11]